MPIQKKKTNTDDTVDATISTDADSSGIVSQAPIAKKPSLTKKKIKQEKQSTDITQTIESSVMQSNTSWNNIPVSTQENSKENTVTQVSTTKKTDTTTALTNPFYLSSRHEDNLSQFEQHKPVNIDTLIGQTVWAAEKSEVDVASRQQSSDVVVPLVWSQDSSALNHELHKINTTSSFSPMSLFFALIWFLSLVFAGFFVYKMMFDGGTLWDAQSSNTGFIDGVFITGEIIDENMSWSIDVVQQTGWDIDDINLIWEPIITDTTNTEILSWELWDNKWWVEEININYMQEFETLLSQANSGYQMATEKSLLTAAKLYKVVAIMSSQIITKLNNGEIIPKDELESYFRKTQSYLQKANIILQ
jgi:hypothetical protein